MAGMDRNTGALISGWDDILQSIRMILSTEIGERIMRRDFGSHVPTLLDTPQNMPTLVDVYVTIVEALEPHEIAGRQYGEPRFALTGIVPDGDESGTLTIALQGIEFPRGHMGDFANARLRNFTL